MKCPICGHLEDKVIDSRENELGNTIRRRRECLKCKKRFTSYERIDQAFYTVIKQNGKRESFSRQRILDDIRSICEKRPIKTSEIESLVNFVEKHVYESPNNEYSSEQIVELIVSKLKAIDKIACIRFALFFFNFQDETELISKFNLLI